MARNTLCFLTAAIVHPSQDHRSCPQHIGPQVVSLAHRTGRTKVKVEWGPSTHRKPVAMFVLSSSSITMPWSQHHNRHFTDWKPSRPQVKWLAQHHIPGECGEWPLVARPNSKPRGSVCGCQRLWCSARRSRKQTNQTSKSGIHWTNQN